MQINDLVKRIFEIVDTYYIDWQAEEIRELIEEYATTQTQKDKDIPHGRADKAKLGISAAG